MSSKETDLLKENKFLRDLYHRFREDKNAAEYGVVLSKDQAENIFPYEYWNKKLTVDEADRNGELFIEYCNSLGIYPRFSGVTGTDGKTADFGDFTQTKGYWKLLIDRRMYDLDGNYREQQKINVTAMNPSWLSPEWAKDQYGERSEHNVMQKDSSGRADKTMDIVRNVLQRIASRDPNALRALQEMQSGDEEDNIRYQLRGDAGAQVKRALTDISYNEEVRLTDNTPSIITSQKGAKNLPMQMNASHIRENILTVEEAKEMGLKVGKGINYHGLGEPLFFKVISGLDQVTLAYRGTKNAENPERRENYFLLISQEKDAQGNVINVPVYINQTGKFNRVYISTNKIATVFGKENLQDYLQREIKKGNLVRIKNRSTSYSEETAPIAADFERSASDSSIAQAGTGSQGKSSPRAAMTVDRIDYLIKDNGAGKRTDYTQGWITSISPTDFINLTTKTLTDRAKFDAAKTEYGSTMDSYDYMAELKENKRQTPYLAVDLGTGEVVGHEGRHRMRALEHEGVQSVPIRIEFRDADGRVVKEMNGYGNPLKKIASFALKNQFGTDYTASVENVLPLMQSMRDEIIASYGDETADVQYSIRNSDPFSARALLGAALTSAVTSKAEREMLDTYQSEAAALDDMQRRLGEVRAEIKALSFAKGPRDTERLTALKSEATRLANNVTTADKRLLRIEASAPLKKVVDAEKQKARAREREVGRAAMQKIKRDAPKNVLFILFPICRRLLLAGAREALAAEHGAVLTRTERHLGLRAALAAHGHEILALASGGLLAGGPAVLAALGLVLKALFRVELLLTGGKHKLFTALFANQCFVFEHVLNLVFPSEWDYLSNSVRCYDPFVSSSFFSLARARCMAFETAFSSMPSIDAVSR